MKDSNEMIAEFVHSNGVELIEGRSIPVREKWFTHYPSGVNWGLTPLIRH